MQNVRMNNGVEIPQMGFGVYMMSGDEVRKHLPEAIKAGYRHIDTANAYFNEVAVGQVVKDSGVKREDFFITTKLWPKDYPADKTMDAVDASLRRLGTDYVDLMLLHQPYGAYTEAWGVLEQAQKEGKVRAIGLSNFPKKKFQQVLDAGTVVPQALQVEINPRQNQAAMKKWLAPKGVVFEGWYPLGHGDATLLQEPAVVEAAKAHDKTPAQAVLRWEVQNGDVVFPKTLNPEHMRQNLDVFDFSLTDDEMSRIDQVPQHPYYLVPDETPDFVKAPVDFDNQN